MLATRLVIMTNAYLELEDLSSMKLCSGPGSLRTRMYFG